MVSAVSTYNPSEVFGVFAEHAIDHFTDNEETKLRMKEMRMKYFGLNWLRDEAGNNAYALFWFLENIGPPFYFERYETRGISGNVERRLYCLVHIDPSIDSIY